MFGHYPSDKKPENVNTIILTALDAVRTGNIEIAENYRKKFSIDVNLIAQHAAKHNQLTYIKKLLAEFPKINLLELQCNASFPVAFYIKENFGTSYWQPKIKHAQMKLALLYSQVSRENEDIDEMRKDPRVTDLLNEISALRQSEKDFNAFVKKQESPRAHRCLIM